MAKAPSLYLGDRWFESILAHEIEKHPRRLAGVVWLGNGLANLASEHRLLARLASGT